MINRYNLKTPFFALAPMAGVTNYPFASQCYQFGADVLWTPMVHTDVILNNLNEALKIIDFEHHPEQSNVKYIVQVVGSVPKDFVKAIKILEKHLNPLGFDINMGCPDKNIVKSGCGGALMNDIDLASDIIKAAKSATLRPISVKTRAGFDDRTTIYAIAQKMVQLKVDMLTIHPRKVTQMYSGKADWGIVKKVKSELKNQNSKMTICGSGDVKTWQDAYKVIEETDIDGVMIGRGSLGKPWIFKEIKEKNDYQPSFEEVKRLAIDLSEKADAIWGNRGIIESRKHYAWYFKGFLGAKELRMQLISASTLSDAKSILE